MNILQLCFLSNLWPPDYNVCSIDIQTGSDVLDLPVNFGSNFDFIVAAPPCDQFTKANSLNWVIYPDYFIKVAKRCFDICVTSSKPWILENPPGRIEKFIPDLSKYRIATWHGAITNKEYIIYSNQLFLLKYNPRYGKPGSVNNWTKAHREAWQPDFFQDLFQYIS
jgi:hypothetical protein